MTQIQTIISKDTFNLVELSQVCGIQSLISEDSINTEVTLRFEFFLQAKNKTTFPI